MRDTYPHTPDTSAEDHGWTLIELLVVISLIMILASVAMNQYNTSIRTAQEAVLKTNLMRMRDAIDQYYADKGQYPSSIQSLVSEGYIRDVPLDPITRSKDTWTTIPAEADPSRPSTEAGIYDVKSGSDGTALDGTRYADWD
jgi:prepilin-type N-terminal cleavage/methylation domain-containing protein